MIRTTSTPSKLEQQKALLGGAVPVKTPAIDPNSLPSLVKRAASQLASATTAAEVLDARDAASVVYDAAKKSARLAKAKGAHDELIAKAHRAQADALEIEAQAKRRLADEYDAAQERGEVRGANERTTSKPEAVGVADIGLTHKEIHEARTIRDAEKAEPGIVRRVLDEKLAEKQEPTKAAVREAVVEAARQGGKAASASGKNPHYQAPTKAGEAWTRLYGTCRALSEWATDENMLLALHGHAERADDQAANVAAIRRAADTLTKFLGEINAQ